LIIQVTKSFVDFTKAIGADNANLVAQIVVSFIVVIGFLNQLFFISRALYHAFFIFFPRVTSGARV
jgi:hypothetical protein